MPAPRTWAPELVIHGDKTYCKDSARNAYALLQLHYLFLAQCFLAVALVAVLLGANCVTIPMQAVRLIKGCENLLALWAGTLCLACRPGSRKV